MKRPSAPTGTPKGIHAWLRQQRMSDGAIVILDAMPLEGRTVVAEWTSDDVVRDPEAWSEMVSELAQGDADARGASTKYELRHVAGNRQVGVMPLRRVVDVPRDGDDDAPPPVTDVGTFMSSMARMLDSAHKQVIESSRVAMQAAQSANETQRASLAMLSQAYTIIATQQNALALAAEEKRESAPVVAAEKSGMAKAGDEAFAMLSKIAVNKYGPQLVDVVLGALVEEFSPSEQSTSETKQ